MNYRHIIRSRLYHKTRPLTKLLPNLSYVKQKWRKVQFFEIFFLALSPIHHKIPPRFYYPRKQGRITSNRRHVCAMDRKEEDMTYIPLVTCIVSFIFAITVLDQYFARRKPYQLLWAIGLFMYSVAAFTEFYTGVWGVTGIILRLWYLIGA